MACISCAKRKKEYLELLASPEIESSDKLVNIYVYSEKTLPKPDKQFLRSIPEEVFTNTIKMYLSKKFFISVFINSKDPKVKKLQHISEVLYKLHTTLF